MLDSVRLVETPTGSAGSAGVTLDSPMRVDGKIHAVYIGLTTEPSTIDITVKTKGNGSMPSQAILTLTNLAASGWYYPRTPTHAIADGSALLYAAAGTPQTALIAVQDIITLVSAQGDPVAAGVSCVVVFEK